MKTTHQTIVGLVTELVIDGMSISEAISGVAGLHKKYQDHLKGSLFSNESVAVFDEVSRRQPQAEVHHVG